MTATPSTSPSTSTDTPESSAPATPHVVKRPKTAGENIFDVATYGGMAMLANEVLSANILNIAKNGIGKREWGKSAYASFEKWCAEAPVLRHFHYANSGRMPYILVATIGGMFTVLPVKWLEDHKGSIVRRLDHFVHGSAADSDPQLQRAHQEMDDAPKQSWGSLWQGRVVTVLSALGLDYLLGYPHALSTKLFEKTPFKNYSSLERAVVSTARHTANLFDPKGKEARMMARDPAKPFDITPGEGSVVKWGVTLGFLTTLSLTLTLLFYWSSKLFATGHEVHEEKEREAEGIAPVNDRIYRADASPAPLAAHTDHTPDSTVSAVAMDGRGIAPSPATPTSMLSV